MVFSERIDLLHFDLLDAQTCNFECARVVRNLRALFDDRGGHVRVLHDGFIFKWASELPKAHQRHLRAAVFEKGLLRVPSPAQQTVHVERELLPVVLLPDFCARASLPTIPSQPRKHAQHSAGQQVLHFGVHSSDVRHQVPQGWVEESLTNRRHHGSPPVPSLVLAIQRDHIFPGCFNWVSLHCQVRFGDPRMHDQLLREVRDRVADFYRCALSKW